MTSAKHHNYLGDFTSLIRVNFRRSALGVGHTVRESEIMALDALAEQYPHDAHIYEIIKQRGSKGIVCHG